MPVYPVYPVYCITYECTCLFFLDVWVVWRYDICLFVWRFARTHVYTYTFMNYELCTSNFFISKLQMYASTHHYERIYTPSRDEVCAVKQGMLPDSLHFHNFVFRWIDWRLPHGKIFAPSLCYRSEKITLHSRESSGN